MDVTLDYEATRKFVDRNGWQAMLEALEDKCHAISGRPLRLYQVSKDWYEDRQYILKGKGGLGDVIVSWAEVPD